MQFTFPLLLLKCRNFSIYFLPQIAYYLFSLFAASVFRVVAIFHDLTLQARADEFRVFRKGDWGLYCGADSGRIYCSW
jgi:hypothetical protein